MNNFVTASKQIDLRLGLDAFLDNPMKLDLILGSFDALLYPSCKRSLKCIKKNHQNLPKNKIFLQSFQRFCTKMTKIYKNDKCVIA